MRATSSDDDTLDQRLTVIAGFPFPFIYTKMVLEVTPTKDPVNAGSVVMQAHLKRITNALPEPFNLALCKGIANPQRVETCLV
jgi:hypothetical protein